MNRKSGHWRAVYVVALERTRFAPQRDRIFLRLPSSWVIGCEHGGMG